MDRCHYCKYLKGGHDPNCPHPTGMLVVDDSASGEGVFRPVARAPIPERMKEWQLGYDDGRSGKELNSTLSPVYQMGWVRGTAALEEAENGYQMWDAPD